MKKFLWVIFALLVAFGVPYFYISAAFDGHCGNKVLAKIKSPDGLLEATAFVRNCGATTAYSVHVFLGATGREAESTGNVFRGTHSNLIEVRWKDDKTLEIITDAKVFLLMKEFSGIVFELAKPAQPKG